VTGRRWVLLAAATGSALCTTGLILLATAAVTAAAMPSTAAAPVPATLETAACVATPGSGSSPVGLSREQLGTAAVIVQVARERHLGLSGAVIGVMTAMTESSLIDVDHGDALGPDSRGLFQQRDPWGPLSVRMDPAGSAGLFYDALQRLPGWLVLPPWIAAQAVQHSKFADGANYRTHYRAALVAVETIDRADGPCPATTPTVNTAQASGSGGVSNGAWGGLSNGQIPASALCPLTATGQLLRCDAAAAWNGMAAAYRTDTGQALCVTDSYRDLATQQELFTEKPGLAAVPGTSNHGWGLAVDLCEPGIRPMGYTTPTYRWLQAHAAGFGWTHPGWADPGSDREEPWHWEYTGTPR
jgi:hypothetical protein